MRYFAKISLTVLTIFIMAIYLPTLVKKTIIPQVEKTHLLYSPTIEQFVWKEKQVGPISAQALAKAEDHHTEISYCTEKGRYLTRRQFEESLPFIYYKNMELWGKLPLRLQGKTITKKEIKKARLVLQLSSWEIGDNHPETGIYPLLESNPKTCRLVFPEDRFHKTSDNLEFINADYNTVDEKLTSKFTKGLKDKGFKFPVRLIFGHHTVLKPFDEGVFLVDAAQRIFHVKRIDGKPYVVKTPIPKDINCRHIKITENKRRRYCGLLLSGNNQLNLISYNNYNLIPLNLPHYDPLNMDFKLLVNPLYITAVYSNEKTIYGVVMDHNFKTIHSYSHVMTRAQKTFGHYLIKALAPFSIDFAHQGNYLSFEIVKGSLLSLIGIGISLLIYIGWNLRFRRRKPQLLSILFLMLCGFFALPASLLVLDD